MSYRSHDDELEASTDRWMVWGAAFMGLLIVLFAFIVLLESSSRADAREEHGDELEALGAEVYATHCTACHGASGEGGIGPALNSQQFLTSADDSQIRALVTVGIPGSQMSAYSIDYGGPLTAEDIAGVASFIRSWEEEAPDNPDWRACCG